MKKILTVTTILTILSFDVFAAVAQYKIVIKDHKFTPKNLEVPVNQKIKLIVELYGIF